MDKNRKQLLYIFWKKEAKYTKVHNDEFGLILEQFQKEGRLMLDEFSSLRKDYLSGAFSLARSGSKGDWFQIRYRNENGYQVIMTNWFDDSKNDGDRDGGGSCITRFEDKFQELNSVGLKAAFGTVEESFKRNIPKQFYYINEDVLGKIIIASSVDASSQYPSGLYGDLPDAHSAITVDGMVEPSLDYPFAYYSNGHLAEFGGVDTRKWVGSPFEENLFRRLERHEDWCQWDSTTHVKTTLMKASKYHMDDVWQYFYDRRKEDPVNKLVMNATIGCFHMKYYDSRKYAHLAALTIARGNQKILDMVDRIGGKEKVIQICVDGILYRGKEQFGIQEKLIGQFHQEFAGCRFKITGTNNYVAINLNGEVEKYKHGSYNYYDDGKTMIEERGVTCFEDMDHWIRIDPLEDIKEMFRKGELNYGKKK